ncbi:MAG: PD-(D/E)XK nuclease family protein [Lachnospiraceae bacterium]|nr:PD-(D/E)XK nuclease family protein [Lachnospiraceae bacterium]
MIDFIFGDAGSGKSRYIHEWLTKEAAEHPDKRYYLFVPEQNTLKAQRELVRLGERHGLLNLDVLSFQLLTYRVIEELGMEKPVVIDDVSKSILIRKAVQETAGELMVYRGKINAPGFLRQVMNLVSEFCQYDIDMDRLKEAAERTELPLLQGKIHDIALILGNFRESLKDKAAIPEDISYLLLSCISRSRLTEDAVLVFDGYTGFTPVQLNILEHLIPKAERCRFTLTIPAEADPYRRTPDTGDDITDLFWLSRETCAEICRIAEKNNIPRGKDTVIRSDRVRPLVRILKAADPTDEARLIARDIRRNARLYGIRYQKMAIASADPAVYSELLKAELEREGIPFFMDDRSDALGSPAVEYVRSVLSAIAGGYRYENLASLLKNPLVSADPLRREEADLADNFLRKTGVRGRKALERIGDSFDFSSVMELEDALKQAQDIRSKADALEAFCTKAELEAWSEALGQRLEEKGLQRQAEECRRFSGMIPELLDRLRVILGNETCTLEEFCFLTDTGFREMKGGLIPEKIDMVLVGDLKRSRFDEIEYLYVIGAVEGSIPSAVTGGGIFTDFERSEIQKQHVTMAPDDKTDSCIQRFYLHLILNKPTKQLMVSYAAEGRDHHPQKPSSVIGDLKKGTFGHFPQIEELIGSSSQLISSAEDALLIFAERAAGASGKDDSFFGLYYALQKAGYGPEADHILEASLTGYRKKPLSKEAAQFLYRDLLEGSVTRIENYEGCPFFHFVRHGLELKERAEFSVEAVDIGNLYHKALDGIFKQMKEQGRDIREYSPEELWGLCDSVVKSVADEYHENIMNSSARNQYLSDKIRRVTGKTVLTLQKQLSDGAFHTEDTEVPFRVRQDRMILHGVIDRLDCCDEGGKTFVRIVDYKSGNKTFTLSGVLNGLELQLVTYLGSALKKAAAVRGSGNDIVPAGMFYYLIGDPVLPYSRTETKPAEERRAEILRMQGAVSGSRNLAALNDRQLASEAETDGAAEQISSDDLKKSTVLRRQTEILSEEDFRSLITYAERRMQEDADRILDGDIEIRPFRNGDRSKCDYCKYHGICGFDLRLPGFRYRNIRSCDRETALDTMRTENAKTKERQHAVE